MPRISRHTILTLTTLRSVQKIVCLTAYTAPFARILDQHVDILLVGDTVNMVLYGRPSTLDCDVQTMIRHGKAVVDASRKALVVVDMPFASYQESPKQAFRQAAQILAQTGCQSVKLEGGVSMAETVRFMVDRGVAVMGHVGLLPQHVHVQGGFRFQGKTSKDAARIMDDACAIANAGAWAIVLEGIPSDLARDITHAVGIPTIGIGASVHCDGQVLVTEDILGLFPEFTPSFVKRYGDVHHAINEAVKAFASDVRDAGFPEA